MRRKEGRVVLTSEGLEAEVLSQLGEWKNVVELTRAIVILSEGGIGYFEVSQELKRLKGIGRVEEKWEEKPRPEYQRKLYRVVS